MAGQIRRPEAGLVVVSIEYPSMAALAEAYSPRYFQCFGPNDVSLLLATKENP
jgi:hypothetical protein